MNELTFEELQRHILCSFVTGAAHPLRSQASQGEINNQDTLLKRL